MEKLPDTDLLTNVECYVRSAEIKGMHHFDQAEGRIVVRVMAPEPIPGHPRISRDRVLADAICDTDKQEAAYMALLALYLEWRDGNK